MNNMMIVVLMLMVSVIAGCGDNFEWFPKQSGPFSNNSTAANVLSPGTVLRAINFPSQVKWVSDIAYDKNSNSFWLLAWTLALPPAAPDAIVKIDAATGAYQAQLNADSWPLTIVDGSSIAYDGSTFWVTSNGTSGGVAASEMYQLTSGGVYSEGYVCPATETGFCVGLAWDGATSSFWSAASDINTLANFQGVVGVITSSVPYTGGWTAGSVTDVAFDSVSGEVFVLSGGIIRVLGASGVEQGRYVFAPMGSARGDWDGKYFWVVDNTSKSLKALFVR